ncbi:MAG TPA: MBL fold metallo-hydrolase [Ktedonobacteraceae bacterium]|nr:MBL fold metallo-hydrolase [Ktedonobacteraceae bacterium]
MADTQDSQSSRRFLVRFWGVRGSYPTPGPHTVRHGGNTSCIEIQVGVHTIILDAGSGIIRLGEELLLRTKGKPLHASVLITHAHGDHLIGFPFFAPLFDSHANIDFFGPSLAGRTIEQLVTPFMSPPYFPVDIRKLPSQRVFHAVTEEQCIIWRHGYDSKPVIVTDREQAKDVEVCVSIKFTHSHPLDGAILYRIEYAGRRVVYATDVEWQEHYDPAFLEFAEGADLLIHDAQYTSEDYQKAKHGFGHSTIEMATGVASAAGVHELILFHHEPTYDDAKLDAMEAQAQAQFALTRSACEGMEIDLLADET